MRKTASALALAQLTERRDRELLAHGFVAQNVVDADATGTAGARAAYTAALSESKSSREVSSAVALQAGSSAAQANAAGATAVASDAAVAVAAALVRNAQINLDRTVIKSPVNGTVIQRNVSVGQTVAAALQAPTLFSIAKDLGRMELDIAVGEPDVGAVRAGQPVSFSVLAYPGRTFTTRTSEVRQNPTIVNNVTTYDTVAYPSNRDGALRPGMTANVQIEVATYRNALIVPLAALQYRPSAAVQKRYRVVAPPASSEGVRTERSAWGATKSSDTFAVEVGGRSRCYVLDGRTLRGVSLTVLAIDGTQVGVSAVAGSLGTGDRVVVDEGTPGSPAPAGSP